MIRTDGKPTIAWERRALDAGGHLGDDVAGVMLDYELGPGPTWETSREGRELSDTLVLEDTALD